MPLISIVIAVHNGARDLEKCLSGIDALTYPNRQCILVDDASTDGMAALGVQSRNVQLITLDRQNGPAFARNVGAEQACGDILFFTDADVVLHPQALSIAAKVLGQDERIAAVFGSYDDDPGHPAYLSQYRNLLHHWVHQSGHSGRGAVL
jgi:glycosyltransferase involved in cell wall biosynthesis